MFFTKPMWCRNTDPFHLIYEDVGVLREAFHRNHFLQKYSGRHVDEASVFSRHFLQSDLRKKWTGFLLLDFLRLKLLSY